MAGKSSVRFMYQTSVLGIVKTLKDWRYVEGSADNRNTYLQILKQRIKKGLSAGEEVHFSN